MEPERKRLLVSVVKELSEDHRNRIRAAAEAHGFDVFIADDAETAKPYLTRAEILFSADSSLLAYTPHLKWVCTPFAGIDSFRGPGVLRDESILLSNSSGAYGITISEHVIMMILMILRKMEDYHAYREEKRWKRDLAIRSIHGSDTVIIGTGDIGQNIAIRLRAFSPRSILGVNQSLNNPDNLFDSVVPVSSLREILGSADLVILSLPKTEATYHMISDAELSLMKDDAVLINVGRGTVIDETALIRHLDNHRLFAGLDVFETEPLPEESPLWHHERTLITPHCSGNMTLKITVDIVVDQFLEDFGRYCHGLPLRYGADVKRGY